jgi:neutral ceramidase
MSREPVASGFKGICHRLSGFAWPLRHAFLFVAALMIVAAPGHAQDLALRAGAAKADITPPLASDMQGPTGKYKNEHLYARAIVLDNGVTRAALIGADQPNLSEEIWGNASQRIAKDLDCPMTNIIMSATHTHSAVDPSAPANTPSTASSLSTDDQRIADGIVSAVHEAKGKLQPAEMSWGTGSIDLNSNRDAIDPKTHLWTQAPNTDAPSDKTVAVLSFTDLSGAPIGIYANYAMHAINGYLANFISADFPGAMSGWVEDAFDDKAIAIFTQNAEGDQNPLYLRPSTNGMASRTGVPITGDEMVRESVEEPLRDQKVQGKAMDPVVRDRLQQWMQAEGLVLGEVVIRAMTHGTQKERNVRIVGQQKEISCPGRLRSDAGAQINSGPTPYVIGMPATYKDGPPIPIRIGMLGIGDVALTHVDAEIYTLIGQRVKHQSPMAHTMVVVLANGRSPSGYIPDDVSFSHLTFQVLASHLKEGCAEDAISNGLTQMVTDYDSKIHEK